MQLNDPERHLAERWDTGHPANPYLTGIHVGRDPGQSGLRGIDGADLELDYPVSVLVGSNGSGKSTLLALAALAYHGSNAFVPPGQSRPWYTFNDFFVRGPGDSDAVGVMVDWSFSDGSDVRMHRRRVGKWMHYERRPVRPVVFLGVSRIGSAAESNPHRIHFAAGKKWATQPLSPESLAAVSAILGRPYTQAETLSSARYSLRAVTGSSAYSGFNMGTGEDALVQLFALLETVPWGGIALIEEVELGLHPQACALLAQEIVKLADRQDIQVICTSHSEWFIGALPRRARILLKRQQTVLRCLTGVTTEVAVSNLSGVNHAELRIICEDATAVAILADTLTSDVRKRVKMIAAGSDSVLANIALALVTESAHAPVLIVWDGDVSDPKIRKFLNSSGLSAMAPAPIVSWQRLPGAKAPETEIMLSIAGSKKALKAVAASLKCSQADVTDSLTRASTLDHHKLFTTVAEDLSVAEEVARTALVAAYSTRASASLTPIRDIVDAFLAGSPPSLVVPA